MPPRKQPIVRVIGLVLTGLSLIGLVITGVDLMTHILPSWEPHWSNDVPAYGSMYHTLSLDLAERLPWLLVTWLSITLLAVSIRLMGLWPSRANLVRG